MNDPAGLAKLQEAVGENLLAIYHRVKPPKWSKRCVNPDEDAPGLEEAMLKEEWFSSGWSTSGDELSIPVKQKTGTQRVKLAPACAWTLYERLATRGKHMICLLQSIVDAPHTPADLRRKAAQRLADDLSHAKVSRQNKLLALAINAGAKSNRSIQLPKHTLLNAENLLEAAARQGQPEIASIIEKHLRCRGTLVRCESCRLLGLLKTPEAAEEAYRLGLDCPGALGDAAIALLWAEDARACDLLHRYWAEHAFLPKNLAQALAEKDSPALRTCLSDAVKMRFHGTKQLQKSLGWLDSAATKPTQNQ